MKNKATVLVSGMIAADPYQGGATWAVLQYVLGLCRLGYDVYFVEPVQPKAIQPTGSNLAVSVNAEYFNHVTSAFGFQQQSTLLLADTTQTVGLSYDRLRQVTRRATVLINISGMLTDPALLESIPIRIYLDIDPAFNQLWSAVQGIDMRYRGHTHFMTIGQGIGEPTCPVPTCGLQWLKTLQPIVLQYWPRVYPVNYNALTTIGNWRGYGSITYQGAMYGQKAHSLRAFFSLPTLTKEQFILALAIHPKEIQDLTALIHNGWQLLDPVSIARTPASYQQFIQHSKAEFGIAKSGYVVSQCGWFSDRSLCYLASGRPVIAQDTGFSHYLPTGEGLFAFRTREDVLGSIVRLRTDYSKHASKARAIAEEYFDSDKVLARLLANTGVN